MWLMTVSAIFESDFVFVTSLELRRVVASETSLDTFFNLQGFAVADMGTVTADAATLLLDRWMDDSLGQLSLK